MKTCCFNTVFKQVGLTLIELIISISIMAIMLSMAIPSFQEFITNARLSTQMNNIVGALATARTKAISTRYDAIVAPVSGTDWTSGFQVFLDKNTDSVFNDGSDELVQKYEAAKGGVTISAAGGFTQVTYRADGRAVTSSFYICSPEGQNKAKAVTVADTGRIRSETDASFDGNC